MWWWWWFVKIDIAVSVMIVGDGWCCVVLACKVSKHRSTETIRLVREGKGGEGGMEVEEAGDYILLATLSPPE